MSQTVCVRISQYGVIADATVARNQLMNLAGLPELAQELHREAVWACLQRLGCDSALPWRQILKHLEEARQQLCAGMLGATPNDMAEVSESSAISLETLEGASC